MLEVLKVLEVLEVLRVLGVLGCWGVRESTPELSRDVIDDPSVMD